MTWGGWTRRSRAERALWLLAAASLVAGGLLSALLGPVLRALDPQLAVDVRWLARPSEADPWSRPWCERDCGPKPGLDLCFRLFASLFAGCLALRLSRPWPPASRSAERARPSAATPPGGP